MKRESIYSFIEIDSNSCWNWTRARNNKGYAIGNFDSGTRLAHRVSYELSNGPVPEGKNVCHHCDNPLCVNPAHLFCGTQKENMQDCKRKGRNSPPPRNISWMVRFPERVLRGEEVFLAKLTDEKVLEIVEARLAGATYTALALKYGVDPSIIGDVCKGKTWRHVVTVDDVENLRRIRAKKIGEKIDAEKAKDIKARLAAGETGRSIAAFYGVHFATVSDIKTGKTWKDA